jgi:acyl-coenzyme A thioesterase PaaI-like protein
MTPSDPARPAPAGAVPDILKLYRRLRRISPGGWLFSRLICHRAPYFATIRPRITVLDAEHCIAEMAHRRAVQNHIGSVHAIALCNLAELTAGVLAEACLPTSMRWIPKGMEVEYLARAKGRMRAEAQPAIAPVASSSAYELPIRVTVRDRDDNEVFRARVRMWITPRLARPLQRTPAPARAGDAS